jgi:hypothetical protein
LSISEKKVYTQDQALLNQEKIDIFCFFEPGEGNEDIRVAGPGSNITGIFTGETSPENWTTKNETRFHKLENFTIEEFDALVDGDAQIELLYDVANNYRRIRDMEVDNIFAFKTASGTYGVALVLDVSKSESGYIEFEYKIK